MSSTTSSRIFGRVSAVQMVNGRPWISAVMEAVPELTIREPVG